MATAVSNNSNTANNPMSSINNVNAPLAGYNLPGVLHYLQMEWRRTERERNEWDIERADLKAKVTLLDGEKKALENTKNDLLLRIKMLEFSLKQERSKFIQLQQKTNANEPSTHTPPISKNESSPIPSNDSPQPTQPTVPNQGSLLNFSKGSGHIRSKEILKKYLIEVGHLPSTSTPIPPNSAAFRMDSPQIEEHNGVSHEAAERLVTPPSKPASPPPKAEPVTRQINTINRNEVKEELFSSSTSEESIKNEINKENVDTMNANDDSSNSLTIKRHNRKPSNPVKTTTNKDADNSQTKTKKALEPNNYATKVLEIKNIIFPLNLLYSHMDSVRALEFHHSQAGLISGSEDCTAKLWNIAFSTRTSDLEPVFTYRGHTGAVTSVAISTDGEVCYTGSVDSTLRAWKLLSLNTDTYGKYDHSTRLHTYVGHSDIIWEIKLHPLQNQYHMIASSSSDGTVKLWDTNATSRSLLSTIWAWGTGSPEYAQTQQQLSQNPTSISWVNTQTSQLAIAYQDSKVRICDIETGQIMLVLESDETYDGTPNTQINKIVCHPTMPMLISGHEDGHVRCFDIKSGKCTEKLNTGSVPISSLDISPDGLIVVWTDHNSSAQWCNLTTKSVFQTLSPHGKKYDEGIWSVRFHPTLDYMATGGADSTIKLYES
ncbi:hypothetical protein HK098_002235 [Nowakowskiella sp. JEL0407]|nr:hypothetical protein HK098_002235 [Nowakowskiella sp. JEL0407]